jgi:hypothetical protein
MIKLRATKREMREGYNKIISVGYCDLQTLLKYESPFAYSYRTEGWSCDYYDIDNVLISTGYAPLSNKNVTCSYDTIRKYEALARKTEEDYLPWYEAKKRMRSLVEKFVSECSGAEL